MRPGSAALALAFAWFALGVASAIWSPLLLAWEVAGGVFAVALVADWMLARSDLDLIFERSAPASWPVGVAGEVTLKLANRSGRGLRLWLYDHHPPEGIAENLPLPLQLPNERSAPPFCGARAVSEPIVTTAMCLSPASSPCARPAANSSGIC